MLMRATRVNAKLNGIVQLTEGKGEPPIDLNSGQNDLILAWSFRREPVSSIWNISESERTRRKTESAAKNKDGKIETI